jgi:tetratricopeptide (TPR) repeat protein
VKKPQWITLGIAVILTATIYLFGRTVPIKSAAGTTAQHTENDGHSHEQQDLTIDSILVAAKRQLDPAQSARINMLENSISRGNVKGQQLDLYHQLSHFWGDTMQFFAPYAWYEGEAARLENSEKTLTFAARLFLDNLQREQDPRLIRWQALQAKDLFERSLKINPNNDSSKVGLGACYLFGNISASPMEGIQKIMEVTRKDSSNVYAQLVLARGSLLSGQTEKAIARLLTVNRISPDNIEAILMLAEVFERKGDKEKAAEWYRKSLQYIKRTDIRTEIEKRIAELQ